MKNKGDPRRQLVLQLSILEIKENTETDFASSQASKLASKCINMIPIEANGDEAMSQVGGSVCMSLNVVSRARRE